MRNGLLPMLKRNVAIKTAPQRWQGNADDGPFDVVYTFEERVFDVVLEGTCPVETALWKTNDSFRSTCYPKSWSISFMITLKSYNVIMEYLCFQTWSPVSKGC
jgi:hypothetical protein